MIEMLTTTLARIRFHRPCQLGWEKLQAALDKTGADDEPMSLDDILKSNGLDDAMWALRAIEGYDGAMRLYACYCARRVMPIYERYYPDDNRVHICIDVAERFARGGARKVEMDAAWDAAWDVAMDLAWVAARGAGCAAWYTARAAARVAAMASVSDEAKGDFTREFIRLCRLEGEYGEVSNLQGAKEYHASVAV
jgi:hypothetical protein